MGIDSHGFCYDVICMKLTHLDYSLVAIMLGRLEMSTTEALTAYDSFASKIFSWKTGTT